MKQRRTFDFDQVCLTVDAMLKAGKEAMEITAWFRDYYLELRGKKELVKSVFELKGKISQKEIAEKLGISEAMVSLIINWKYL
jgi:hypothetical protein